MCSTQRECHRPGYDSRPDTALRLGGAFRRKVEPRGDDYLCGEWCDYKYRFHHNALYNVEGWSGRVVLACHLLPALYSRWLAVGCHGGG
jgi:hypothetical protein